MTKIALIRKSLTIILGLYSFCIFSQNPVVVSGRICKNDSLPIIGTSVFIKGTTIGTISDMEGKYSITIPDSLDSVVLQYSFIGFEMKYFQLIRDSIDTKKFVINTINNENQK